MILQRSTIRALLALVCAANVSVASGMVKFKSCLASDSPSSFEDLTLTSRTFVPYGLNKINPSSGEYGYGYGMGALERVAYDHLNMYLYGSSEQGQVTVTDFSDVEQPVVLPTEFMIDAGGKTLTDIQVCPEIGILMFTRLTNGKGGQGDVLLYRALKRTKDVEYPETKAQFLMSIPVGSHPDMVLPSPKCDMMAVANEGEGTYDDDTGLTDPEGSVTLIELDPQTMQTTTTNIALDKWDDDELLSMGVHLPLSKNALTYWNTHSGIAGDLNFDDAISSYTSAQNLEPEYLAWSADGKYLYVNLQENSAIVTIDVKKKEAVNIKAIGLRDWSSTNIDVFKDDGCSKMVPVSDLYSAPMPDAITSVAIDGQTYILTADEGDDKEYGDYEEKVKFKDLLAGEVLDGITPSFDCDESLEKKEICESKLRVTIGSPAVNYDDPTKPVFEKVITLGGRGISILKATGDMIENVWDSKDEFEKAVCETNPWAHNSVQDEEFAPVNGVLYNTTDDDLRETIREVSDPEEDGCDDQGDGTPGACPLQDTVDERSLKDGPAPEAITTGIACGRLFAVTSSEKGGSAFLYDITDINAPILAKTFHLTPGSKELSAGLAYEQRVIGEVDAESVLFLDEKKSPTKNPIIMFAGAWSGTVSLWEFECASDFKPKKKCKKKKPKCPDNNLRVN